MKIYNNTIIGYVKIYCPLGSFKMFLPFASDLEFENKKKYSKCMTFVTLSHAFEWRSAFGLLYILYIQCMHILYVTFFLWFIYQIASSIIVKSRLYVSWHVPFDCGHSLILSLYFLKKNISIPITMYAEYINVWIRKSFFLYFWISHSSFYTDM